MALLLADLGVTKTHARLARVQRQPVLRSPVQDAEVPAGIPRAVRLDPGRPDPFFPWYNTEHHHSSLGLLTPADVHHDVAEQRAAARAVMLATAYAAHPERFPCGLPQPPARTTEVWINPPAAGSGPIQAGASPPG